MRLPNQSGAVTKKTARAPVVLTLAVLSLALIQLSAPPTSQASKACRPPKGPGDNLVHSFNLRASGVGCKLARQVVLASTKGSGHYSEAVPFNVGGYKWRCHATAFPESHQSCNASPHKRVTIIWGD